MNATDANSQPTNIAIRTASGLTRLSTSIAAQNPNRTTKKASATCCMRVIAIRSSGCEHSGHVLTVELSPALK